MTAIPSPARRNPLVILGSILVLIGLLAVVGRAAGLDLEDLIGEQTWPFLVIVPGLVLLGLTFTTKPPDGLGFVISGSIVTTVGAILLYQANTDAWDSWPYAWALIPGAAGIGKAAYGSLTGQRDLVGEGLRLALIAGVLFAIGWWYFEALFTTGRVPIDVAAWWPFALIVVGVLIAARAMLGDGRRPAGDTRPEGRP